MSEERFKKMDTIIDPFPIWDTVEEKGYNCTDTLELLVDLLNELSEENNKLKEINEDKEQDVLHLYKENEQLKQSNDRFADTVAKQVSLLIELRKENELLKQKLENIGLNEKNDTVKMIDGKVFIRM